MNEVHYNHISAEEENQRLDNYLIRILKGVPKSHVYRIIRSGEVRINKKRAKALTRINGGDIVRLPPVKVAAPTLKQYSQDFSWFIPHLIYEDEVLIVVNKPAGL